jgi:hypothetical protein
LWWRRNADRHDHEERRRAAGQAAPDFAAGWRRHLDALGYLARGTGPAGGRPAWAELHQRYRALAGAP